MILLNCPSGSYWINPRYITDMWYGEITDYMYKHYSDEINGATHYTKVRTVHSGSYDVLATPEEILELMKPYLG